MLITIILAIFVSAIFFFGALLANEMRRHPKSSPSQRFTAKLVMVIFGSQSVCLLIIAIRAISHMTA